MSRLPELHVVEDEQRLWRIRKVHGVWCIQHLESHQMPVVVGGEPVTIETWAFVKAFDTHPEAMGWFDTFLHYDPAHHRLEACS